MSKNNITLLSGAEEPFMEKRALCTVRFQCSVEMVDYGQTEIGYE